MFVDSDKIRYSGVFGLTDYLFEFKVQNFKMVDPIWRTKLKKLLDSDKALYSGVFGLTDFQIQKLNMTDKNSPTPRHF